MLGNLLSSRDKEGPSTGVGLRQANLAPERHSVSATSVPNYGPKVLASRQSWSTIHMPTWTEQDLHVVGSAIELTRFVHASFTRRKRKFVGDLLRFTRLCPLKRGEPKAIE